MEWLTGKVLHVALRAAVPALLGGLIALLVSAQLLDPGVEACLESKLSESSSIPHSSPQGAFPSPRNKWQGEV